ncbi:hydroxyisourate hydrolase [Streptomyces sp. H51]|uniref:hydroxyisourate hydrolase n=1 Tax=Streptomyces sp. H51 TaxID=3111770 RepID=UPI002D798D9D|nr:hydroxyisourate hydrolase [Streptomyces sp. H51]
MSTRTTASVSTHVLDTSAGRPAAGVTVRLLARDARNDQDPQDVRDGRDAGWRPVGGSVTDADGRCRDLPDPPEGTTHVRLDFAVEAYLERSEKKQADARQDAPANRGGGAVFFPEVSVTFAVVPGEHYHVPLLLSPFGYSVYRGS